MFHLAFLHLQLQGFGTSAKSKNSGLCNQTLSPGGWGLNQTLSPGGWGLGTRLPCCQAQPQLLTCLHFSLLRMGSCGTFALYTASSRCTRIAGLRAAMSFFLAQILLTNVIRTYTEGYTRSWSRSQAVRFQATHGKDVTRCSRLNLL